jgi:hypothetical protein
MKELHTEIAHFMMTCEIAWNARQPGVFTDLFSEDGNVMCEDGQLIQGKNRLEEWWRDYFTVLDRASRSRFTVGRTHHLSRGITLLDVTAEASGPGIMASTEQSYWIISRESHRWLIAAIRGRMPTTTRSPQARA